MKFIHLYILLLVCVSGLSAALVPVSHNQIDNTELDWLDAELLEQIRSGQLVVVRDMDQRDANDYQSKITQRVIHIWWEPEMNSWEYKIVDYYVDEEEKKRKEYEAQLLIDKANESANVPEEQPQVVQPQETPVNQPVVPESSKSLSMFEKD